MLNKDSDLAQFGLSLTIELKITLYVTLSALNVTLSALYVTLNTHSLYNYSWRDS